MVIIITKIKGDPEKDQHFMINKKVLKEMIDIANITKDDCVLEIGAGYGNLTSLLAKKSKIVYAIEKDKKFKESLEKINKKHRNIRLIFGDALDINYPNFNKIVSNMPYGIVEGFFQKIINHAFEIGVMTLPSKFVKKISPQKIKNTTSLLSIQVPLFYKIEIIRNINKSSFSPPPRVKSSLVKIKPRKKLSFKENILKELFKQSDKKLKNALRESIINSYKNRGKRYTKREAKGDIEKLKLGNLLDKKVSSLSFKDFKKTIRELNRK